MGGRVYRCVGASNQCMPPMSGYLLEVIVRRMAAIDMISSQTRQIYFELHGQVHGKTPLVCMCMWHVHVQDRTVWRQ